MVRLVILGLGAAGFGAVLSAKKQRRDIEITIIDNKDFDLMHSCGLPFFLEGTIDNIEKLKHSINAERMGVRLCLNSHVTGINIKDKTVEYEKDGKREKIKYDKLIIATGSKPFIPPIKTNNKVFTINRIEDVEKLETNIEKGKKAIIIGAGAIGLECAVALNKRGIDVEVIDMLPSTFPKAIDKDISEILEEKLKRKGIKLRLGEKIDEIKEKAVVIMATGVRPNIDFLPDEIETNKFGIKVNEEMQTNVKDIYAAGDCCCVFSLINKEEMPSQLANNAYKEGTVAGSNAVGGNQKYDGILNTFVSLIDDIEIASTGFNSFFADYFKIKTITSKAKGLNRPRWFGESKEIVVKLIADEKERLIGGQAIGTGAKERINIIATAIKSGFTLKDVFNLELAYCPALSDYYDVLNMAAEYGLRKLNKS